MLLYTAKAYQFKQISETLKDILSECWFVFEMEHFTMKNVDPEKVVSVDLFVKPPRKDYNCTTRFVFPFYIQTLYRIFRGVRPNDMATIQDNHGDGLIITIHTDKGVVKNVITMKPLNSPVISFESRPVVHHISVEFECSQLYSILRDLSSISRRVTLEVKEQDIIFTSEDDYGTISTCSQFFPVINHHYLFKKTYLAKYLEKFSKPGLGMKIFMRLANDYPLEMLYNLEHGSLTMSISPSD